MDKFYALSCHKISMMQKSKDQTFGYAVASPKKKSLEILAKNLQSQLMEIRHYSDAAQNSQTIHSLKPSLMSGNCKSSQRHSFKKTYKSLHWMHVRICVWTILESADSCIASDLERDAHVSGRWHDLDAGFSSSDELPSTNAEVSYFYEVWHCAACLSLLAGCPNGVVAAGAIQAVAVAAAVAAATAKGKNQPLECIALSENKERKNPYPKNQNNS